MSDRRGYRLSDFNYDLPPELIDEIVPLLLRVPAKVCSR